MRRETFLSEDLMSNRITPRGLIARLAFLRPLPPHEVYSSPLESSAMPRASTSPSARQRFLAIARLTWLPVLSLSVVLPFGIAAATAYGEENAGQAELDSAINAKLSANNPQDFQQVLDLCKRAIDKGLSEESAKVAEEFYTATLFDRGRLIVEVIFNSPTPSPQWPKMRSAALRDLREAIDRDPKLGPAQLMIARLESLPGGNKARAKRAAEAAMELLTDDNLQLARAHVIRGNLEDDKEKQLADYDTAVKLAPADKDVRRTRGLYYLLNDDYEKARADIEAAIAKDPDDASLQEALGMAYMMDEKLEEAQEAFDKAIELAPESSEALLQRARVLAMRGEQPGALADLDKAIALAPDPAIPLVLRARIHQQAGNTEQAKADIDAVLERDPNNAAALELRGLMVADPPDLAMPQSARGEGRYALLVGVEKYDPSELAPLDFAEDDVEAMGRALEKLGFSVVTMTSASPVAARRPVLADDILAQVDRRLADREKTDTVVLAFSGHGVQLKAEQADASGAKELWFCPERARPGDPRTLLAMSEVLKRLERCAAGRKLLLVDACRNDFEPTNGSKSGRVIELPAAGVKRPPIPAGLVAMFSCRPGEQSFELNDLRHSIFSHHVIEFLEGRAPADRYPRGEVGITELTSYVRTKTRDTADVRLDRFQVPDVVLPDGSFGEWPLGRLGQGPAAQISSAQKGASAGEVRDFTALGIRFCWCPPGRFKMGALDDYSDRVDKDEKPPVSVEISTGYWIGQGEVSQAQWKQIMGRTLRQQHSRHKSRESNLAELESIEGADYAICFVTYSEASEFCRKLTDSERTAGRLKGDWVYRLPTEAEWEYACRSETTTQYWWGTSIDDQPDIHSNKWYPDQQKILSYRRNNWNIGGLTPGPDEWVLDAYSGMRGGTDPVNRDGDSGVLRGMLSSTNRVPWSREELNGMGNSIGFRLVLGRPILE